MSNIKSIDKLIEDSFEEFSKIGEEKGIQQNTKPRLIYPKYRNGKKRVSEQELRFLLVRELEKQKEFYYSIETPTEGKYEFKGKKQLSARSALIDLCLYNSKGERTNLIELKHKNVDVKKDFLKLLCEPKKEQNYFIHFVDNSDSGTIPSIEKKYQEALKFIKFKSNKEIKSDVKIFLFVIGDAINKKPLRRYEIKNGKLNKKEVAK